MKKLLLFLLSLVPVVGVAQELENSLLWKISGNGLKKPSYLYGTVHITCDATLDANTLKALDETSQLYLELDMDDPNMQGQMMSTMMMKDGVKMSSLVTEDEFALIDQLFTDNLGFSAKMFDNVKPSLAQMMLMPKMLDCPMQSVEGELMKITKQQNEEVYGLETVASQMAVFDAIPYKEQMAELLNTARDNMASDREKYKRMMKIYESKDLNAIKDFMQEEENKMYDDHSDILLDDRNKKWIAKIEAAAKEKPTFFGVGAAHLPGENGVIKLLRKQGFKVEAVK